MDSKSYCDTIYVTFFPPGPYAYISLQKYKVISFFVLLCFYSDKVMVGPKDYMDCNRIGKQVQAHLSVIYRILKCISDFLASVPCFLCCGIKKHFIWNAGSLLSS